MRRFPIILAIAALCHSSAVAAPPPGDLLKRLMRQPATTGRSGNLISEQQASAARLRSLKQFPAQSPQARTKTVVSGGSTAGLFFPVFEGEQRLGNGMAIVNAIPETPDEFRRVFPTRQTTQADLSAMKTASRNLKAMPHNRTLAEALKGEQSVVVIVGHNEGGALRFPNGDLVPLSKIAAQCGDALKICLFIVCNSDGVSGPSSAGLSRKIGPQEAAQKVAAMSAALEKAKREVDISTFDVEAFPAVFEEFRRDRSVEFKTFEYGPIWVVALGVVGGAAAGSSAKK